MPFYRLIAAAGEEDPVQLLVNASHNYVPVDQSAPTAPTNSPISKLKERPSMETVLNDVTKELWYIDQVAHHRSLEAAQAKQGKNAL